MECISEKHLQDSPLLAGISKNTRHTVYGLKGTQASLHRCSDVWAPAEEVDQIYKWLDLHIFKKIVYSITFVSVHINLITLSKYNSYSCLHMYSMLRGPSHLVNYSCKSILAKQIFLYQTIKTSIKWCNL